MKNLTLTIAAALMVSACAQPTPPPIIDDSVYDSNKLGPVTTSVVPKKRPNGLIACPFGADRTRAYSERLCYLDDEPSEPSVSRPEQPEQPRQCEPPEPPEPPELH